MMKRDDELIEKMWIAFRHAPNPQMRAVLAVVREHDGSNLEIDTLRAEQERLKDVIEEAATSIKLGDSHSAYLVLCDALKGE